MTKEKPAASRHSLRFTRPLPTFATPSSVEAAWWRMTGSNRRPPACKAGALPAELIPLALAFDKRRIAALLHGLPSFRYAARSRALRCLLLEAHRFDAGLIHHPSATTLVCENQAGQGGASRRIRLLYASDATTPSCADYRRPMVGLGGFEPPTPALSRRCSNQLSYRPAVGF